MQLGLNGRALTTTSICSTTLVLLDALVYTATTDKLMLGRMKHEACAILHDRSLLVLEWTPAAQA